MKKMKKIVTSLVAAALISGVNASADLIQTDYKALNGMHINAEYASMDMGGTSTSGMEYGLGYDYYGKSFLVGVNYNLIAPSDDTFSNMSFSSFQLDLGYRVLDTLTAYGIVSYDMETELPMDGVGYGAGVKYQVLPYVAINAKYKTTSMTDAFNNTFDYSTMNIGLEFNFRTGDGKDRW